MQAGAVSPLRAQCKSSLSLSLSLSLSRSPSLSLSLTLSLSLCLSSLSLCPKIDRYRSPWSNTELSATLALLGLKAGASGISAVLASST